MRSKYVSLFIIISIVLLLAACGATADAPIDEHEWSLRAVLQATDNVEELMIAGSEQAIEGHENAKLINMTLTASDGEFTVTDNDSGKTYTGEYKVTDVTMGSSTYEISINGESGHAVTAMTTYADGTREPTLAMRIGEYSLSFYDDSQNHKGETQ